MKRKRYSVEQIVEGVARVGAKKAPDIGEHSVEVQTAMGLDASATACLRKRGVVG